MDIYQSPVFSNTGNLFKFNRDGYVVVPSFLNPEQIQYLQNLFDTTRDKAAVSEQFYTSHWSSNREYRAEVKEKIVALLYPLAQKVLTDYRSIYGHLMIKNPGSNSQYALHQDWSLVDESTHTGITVWIPLVDVTKANGCLGMLRGSHRLCNNVRGSNIGTNLDINSFPETAYTFLEMKAGDAVFFHQRIFHLSPPNNSNQTRVAAGLVLIPNEAKVIHYYKEHDDKTVTVFEADDNFLSDFYLGETDIKQYKKTGDVPLSATVINKDEFVSAVMSYKD
ncbi:MAG: phytanoyl-CoA dioxygenase family protein [Bacteroidota bacterium]